MKISFNAPVQEVRERFAKRHLRGVGEKAEFKNDPLGWTIVFGYPYYLIFHVPVEPTFKAGDTIKITMEKTPDAQP